MSVAVDCQKESIIDGKLISNRVAEEIAFEIQDMRGAGLAVPGLAVVLVGSDAASSIYVRRKVELTKKVGMLSLEYRLDAETSETDLLALISGLNRDQRIHGILVQLPLPAHIDARRVLDAIDPAKDVDGFHPVNVGRHWSGTGGLVPCTPLGCMILLESVVEDCRGLVALVIGKSNIVGKPVTQLLLEKGCTVTVAHSATRDLAHLVAAADIVVVAVGRPGLVRRDWIKEGAIVIDVGINRVTNADGSTSIVGDVEPGPIPQARAVTPVPGGVGPMTIACLLANTVKAAKAARHE